MRGARIVIAVLFACGDSDPAGGSTSSADTSGATTGDRGTTGALDTTSSGASTSTTTTEDSGSDTGRPDVAWDAGSIRVLPVLEGDLVELVEALDYPQAGAYEPLTDDRAAKIVAFVDAMDVAIATGLHASDDADWCGVLDLAAQADYSLHRFHDAPSERWFLFAQDTSSAGQAYLVVNPEPKRDVVIEVPHHPHDAATAPQGARLLRALAARALLLNKEHRCSAPEASECPGTTTVCDGSYRASDPAHDTRTAFHLLHRRWSDGDPDARFVQLHGFDAPPGDHAEVGDGTSNDLDPRSIATLFAAALASHGPEPTAIHACQGAEGPTPAQMCGANNVQGRATNEPSIDACLESTTISSGRFVHLEQSAALRDDDEGDGWSWTDVRDAIADVWPDCTLGRSADDCALGPAQAEHPACTCGQPCR